MRTAQIQVLKFDELSETAKQKARDWFREASAGEQWWSRVYEDAKAAGAMFGFDIDDIYFSGFWSQGDGACFTGSFRYGKGCENAIKAAYPEDKELHTIAAEWVSLQRLNFYQVLGIVQHRGTYQHSGCTYFEIEVNGREPSDELERGVKSCIRSFMDWIYSELEKEHQWLNSEEYVDATIVGNEYEFTADGEFYQ
ncbi:hypothetical protein [Pseudomonas sp. P8_250]|uniref:hypothetical protein n=1 Tax=Pseudomonas sp. P8_250 TaxID=3043446 RepID=UPI002A35BF1A|nr:hypothetical protein [Pseudomonas sp. P8_250]MDX9668740.1 hypothetical protein [Pseudomonas sp. P8_250]